MAPVDPSFQGHVFWLFGLSGAGKSTIAERLTADIRARGIPVLTLDGDILRSGLCQGLGFSDEHRAENLRRAAEAAKLGVNSRLCVVASFITPQENHRRLVMDIIGGRNLSLIHVTAPLDICRQRDVKGLYAGASAGKVAQMTGVSSAFESPIQVDLALQTAEESADACTRRLLEFSLRFLDPAA